MTPGALKQRLTAAARERGQAFRDRGNGHTQLQRGLSQAAGAHDRIEGDQLRQGRRRCPLQLATRLRRIEVMADLGIYVGTVGMSMWASEDRGQTWMRPYGKGLYGECRVFSLTSQPADGSSVLAGTDQGIYRWHQTDHTWEYLPSPMDDTQIWSLVQSPHDAGVLLAGTRKAQIFRSEDGGTSWHALDLPLATECAAVEVPRVTQIVFDPQDPKLVWFGVELDGVWRSEDGGKSFDKHVTGLDTEDIHGLTVAYQDGQRWLFATTNRGLFTSLDGGLSWQSRAFDSDSLYTRSIVERADHTGVLFMTNGNGPPGSTGRLLKSNDYGETWSDVHLPGEPNSTPWCIAVHPADPDLVFTCTNLGLLYRSQDGGETWSQLKRQFGEIRALILRPLAD
jgi:photosystem II stability/assembly factor-like uncharacterized protein